MLRLRSVFGIALIGVTASLLSSCATSPTGRNQLILVSDSAMDQMGAASFAQMKKKSPPTSNTTLNRYVKCISEPLLRAAGENPSQWEVQVFADKSPNAFALPGRKIGVHLGMIQLAQNSDQLAAVIGHEIGHVQAKHGAERVSMGQLSQTVQQVAAQGLNGTAYGGAAMAAIGLGAKFGVLLPYSRQHETEADYIGLKYMAKAGFNPQQAVELWKQMSRASGGQSPPEFMSTHPSNQSRISDLNAKMSDAMKVYQTTKSSGVSARCAKPRV